MKAVIKTGGKQYLVEEGMKLRVEKLEGEVGAKVNFDVLMIDDGNDVDMGAPLLEKAKVEAEILETGRDKKIPIIKYKPKVNYRRNVGHRQPYTDVKIVKISK
jgi:large subunit ribosomal protein L21